MPDPEIVAPPHPVAAAMFARYTRRLVGTHFAGVYLGGYVVERQAGELGRRMLFVANHSNWWDGFLAVLLSERLGLHFNILMEAKHLERYWMFKWIGALPVNRDSAPAAYAQLASATGCLRRADSGLWVFPQGKRRPPREPIVGTERGAAEVALAAGPGVQIVPVALRYAYLGEQLPEAFVWVGEPFTSSATSSPASGLPAIETAGSERRQQRTRLTLEIERRLQATADGLDQRLAGERLDEFRVLLPGKLSINKRLDRVRHLLRTVDGPFQRRNG